MEDFNITAVIIFAITMSITPGPNNIMLTASGAAFGFKRTIPHILGIVFGIALLNIACAAGLKQLFYKWPVLKTYLKYTGFIYMFYLAFMMCFKGKLKNNKEVKNNKPIHFYQGALFQLFNPKALLMSISAMTLYTTDSKMFRESSIYIIVIFILCGLPSISLWAAFGTAIGKFLKSNKNGSYINYIMGVLTAGCAIYIVLT